MFTERKRRIQGFKPSPSVKNLFKQAAAEGDGVVWPGEKGDQGVPNHALNLPERSYSLCIYKL